MRSKKLAFLMCSMIVGPSFSQPKTATMERASPALECTALAQRIEDSEKEIAKQLAAGIGDNSAPRETSRLLERLFEQAYQSQQLSMMVALKCPVLPVTSLVRGRGYFAQALRCQRAFIGGPSAETAELCDQRKWTPATANVPAASGS